MSTADSEAPESLALVEIHGVVIGKLVAWRNEGDVPIVMYSCGPRTVTTQARAAAQLSSAQIGQSVALMFEHGRSDKPIVVGVLPWPVSAPGESRCIDIEADGERVVVSAGQQLVLQCGKASITLTRAGKVLIEGAYIVSRSSGENKVKGARIELN